VSEGGPEGSIVPIAGASVAKATVAWRVDMLRGGMAPHATHARLWLAALGTSPA